jgi:alpha-glucosidase
MPPRWALGYLQSTRHFENSEELRGLPRRFRDKNIPCDALIVLSTYSDFRGWNRGVGHLECEPKIIPDPVALFAHLRSEHVHLVTHEYPVLHQDSPLYDEALAKGYLLEEGYPRLTPTSRPSSNYREGQRFIDFSNPDARAWWWREHRRLRELGVEGWWLDGGEGPSAEAKLHGGTGAALHNRYDLLRQRAFFDGEKRDRPEQRPFLLCRSGGAGMQRFGAACWSGDINNTFATFEHQPALALNVGLSGIPYWNSDIGGFYSVAPDSEELFLRWFQFGAFCPIFRSHGHSWRLHLPWSYGEKAEAICRDYIGWRYRLMPYTYTLAFDAHRHGLPLMRPLILNYSDDPRACEIADVYLWGDDLLVAPVTRDGARHWPVYLPKGTWYDFWTHEMYKGPKSISVEAPLDRLPLFVRQGALLPLGPVLQYEGERELTEITVLVYPADRSSFTLYEDDGRTRAYERGSFALTEISCETVDGDVICTLGAASGEASLLPADRRYALKVYSPKRPRKVEVDGKWLARRKAEGEVGWTYERPFVVIEGLRQPTIVKLFYA